jgi:hypothetical protein
VDPRPAVAHTEIVHRPHIGSVELKEQEHLSGPASDTANADQARDDLVVARSMIAASLFAESPAARSTSGLAARTASGATGSPPNAATSRPWMARAAAPASC